MAGLFLCLFAVVYIRILHICTHPKSHSTKSEHPDGSGSSWRAVYQIWFSNIVHQKLLTVFVVLAIYPFSLSGLYVFETIIKYIHIW